MSTSARDIIKGAMRKIGVLPIGREPSTAEAADALDILQDLYRELVGQGVFGPIIPTIVTADTYTAHENERVIVDNASGCAVTLPDTITQEWNCDYTHPSGNYRNASCDYGFGATSMLPRQPRDHAIVTIAHLQSDFEDIVIYDAQIARWVLVSAIGLSDVAPLSSRFGNALRAILATRLAAPYGVELPPQLQSEANSGRYQLSTRFDRSARRVVGEYI